MTDLATRPGGRHAPPRWRGARPCVFLARWREPVGRLFPSDPGWPVTAGRVAVALAALAAGTALSLARQSGPGALDTLWAEDGTIFLHQALTHSVVGTFGISYAGYLHAVPRALAAVAGAFPLSYAAAAYAVLAALTLSGVALFVYAASGAHLRHRPLRAALALSFVVLPIGQGEVVNNVVANLHFPLMAATFWALVWNPRRRAGQLLAVAVVALSVLSDPTTVLLAPVALARVVTVRTWRGWAAPGALLVGFAVQMVPRVAGATSRDFHPFSINLLKVPAYFVFHVVTGGLLGDRLPGTRVGSARGAVAVLVAAVVVAVAGWVLWRHRRMRTRMLVAALVGETVLLYLLPLLLTGLSTPRYALAPALLLIGAVLATLDGIEGGARGLRWQLVPRLAGVSIVLIAAISNFRMVNPRSDGPRWSAELRIAVTRCASLPQPSVAVVKVSPSGWQADLPCLSVTAHRAFRRVVPVDAPR